MKAIVFVDVQKDFINGALANDKAVEAVPKIVEFARECIKAGHKIYATRDTHERTGYWLKNVFQSCYEPKSGYLATLEGQKLPVEHCIEGAEGWMIDERLWAEIEGKVTVVNKPTFGSFDLAAVIGEDFTETYQYIENLHCRVKCCPKESGELDEIVIVGFCSDICVISNALMLRAKFPDTKISVMKELCAGSTPEKHEAAMEVMKSCQIDVV